MLLPFVGCQVFNSFEESDGKTVTNECALEILKKKKRRNVLAKFNDLIFALEIC